MSDFTINFDNLLQNNVHEQIINDQRRSFPASDSIVTSKASAKSTGFPSALGLTDVFMNAGLTGSGGKVQGSTVANLLPLQYMATGKSVNTLNKNTKTIFEDVWRGYVSPDVLKSLEDLTDAQYQKIFGEAKDDLNQTQTSKGSTSESSSSGTNASASGPATTPTLTGNTGQYKIGDGFGAPRGNGTHTGIDFSTPSGTPVIAPVAGTVVDAGVCNQGLNDGFGIFVVLHVVVNDTNYVLIYGHLQSVSVSKGQTVAAGQLLGLTDNTGRSDSPHLHFEMRTGETEGSPANALDPMPFLNSGWQIIGAPAP